VAKSPEWAAERYLAELEGTPVPPGRTVADCLWHTSEQGIVSVPAVDDPAPVEIAAVDLSTQSVRRLALAGDAHTAFTASIVGGSAPFIVSQSLVPQGVAGPTLPLTVDVTTGEVRPVLQQGDWVVAVLSP